MATEDIHSLVILLISVVAIIAISRLARIGRLSFRYTIGWIAVFVVSLLAAPRIGLIGAAGNWLRLSPASAYAVAALLLLAAISIQLSISISGAQEQTRTLCEQVALLALERETSQTRHGVNRHHGLRVLALIPAFNESKSISAVISEVLGAGFEILVVSDGSTDETASIARRMGVPVLEFPINLGVGAALRGGFRYACAHGYDAVVQVDADGQHRAGDLGSLVEVAAGGHHMVIGSRFLSNDTSMRVGMTRRIAMVILASLATRATGTRITDASSGFRCITQPLLGEFARNFPATYLGDTYEALLAAGRGRYRVCEVPTAMNARTAGESSASTLVAMSRSIRAVLVGLLRFHVRVAPYSPQ